MEITDKQKSIREQKFFARGDVAVYLASLLLIVVFTVFAFAIPKEKGEFFSVYYGEQLVFEGSLSEDAEYIFRVEDGEGVVLNYRDELKQGEYNVIAVANGKVSVRGASCPDHTCMYQGETDWGEILCLPHKMKIVVEGEGLVTDL